MLALPWQQQNINYVKYLFFFFLSITYFHLASHILWLILFILFSCRYYTQGLNLSLLPTDSMREFIKHSSP